MLSEKMMEDAISSNPEKYLGEKGMKLIARQYNIGSYIFDLLFEDRLGSKLIVELQRGTLDRIHTYKILDYYDEYKQKNPKEFIELMVIANRIPHERRRRLEAHGISWKEIPESKFDDVIIKDNISEISDENTFNISVQKQKNISQRIPFYGNMNPGSRLRPCEPGYSPYGHRLEAKKEG